LLLTTFSYSSAFSLHSNSTFASKHNFFISVFSSFLWYSSSAENAEGFISSFISGFELPKD
jgi:hypothetical protein